MPTQTKDRPGGAAGPDTDGHRTGNLTELGSEQAQAVADAVATEAAGQIQSAGFEMARHAQNTLLAFAQAWNGAFARPGSSGASGPGSPIAPPPASPLTAAVSSGYDQFEHLLARQRQFVDRLLAEQRRFAEGLLTPPAQR